VQANEQSVEVTFEDRRWVFPRGDCILLPVANTTTELLAQYIGQRLLESLAASGRPRPARLRIEVDECYGQLAVWDWAE
jgi:6-pyruvoyltetrahydropterin/6-carboxytetrahydropterin synthase